MFILTCTHTHTHIPYRAAEPYLSTSAKPMSAREHVGRANRKLTKSLDVDFIHPYDKTSMCIIRPGHTELMRTEKGETPCFLWAEQ